MGNNDASRHITSTRRNAPDSANDDALTIIIPAASVGKRMKSLGPKALLTLNRGVTILESQLKKLWSEYPQAEIIVVTGFQGDKVRKQFRGTYPVRFVTNPFYEDTNVAYSLQLALQAAISPRVLIVYGDLVFNASAIRTIATGPSAILVDSKEHFKTEEVGVQTHDGVVTNLSYGLNTKWGQMVYLIGRELRLFEISVFNTETEKWFGYEVLNNVINRGGVFSAIEPPYMRIVEVDTPKDLERARMI